jgi:hypothetical protein
LCPGAVRFPFDTPDPLTGANTDFSLWFVTVLEVSDLESSTFRGRPGGIVVCSEILRGVGCEDDRSPRITVQQKTAKQVDRPPGNVRGIKLVGCRLPCAAVEAQSAVEHYVSRVPGGC